jgi:hypothetical protein
MIVGITSNFVDSSALYDDKKIYHLPWAITMGLARVN